MSPEEHDITRETRRSRGAWYDDVAEAMGDMQAGAEEAQRREAEATRASNWRMVVLLASVASFAVVMTLNIAPMLRGVEPLSQESQEASLDAMAQMVAHRIEAYREARGELPTSLEALGLPLDDFDYYPMGEEFELVAWADEVGVVYRSGDRLPTLYENGLVGEAGTADSGSDPP